MALNLRSLKAINIFKTYYLHSALCCIGSVTTPITQTLPHSDIPIGAHPLYALPDKVKHRANISDSHRSTQPSSHVTIKTTSLNRHVTQPGGHVTTADESEQSSEQLISEDPLYAVPEQVKKRLNATHTHIDGENLYTVQSLSYKTSV